MALCTSKSNELPIGTQKNRNFTVFFKIQRAIWRNIPVAVKQIKQYNTNDILDFEAEAILVV